MRTECGFPCAELERIACGPTCEASRDEEKCVVDGDDASWAETFPAHADATLAAPAPVEPRELPLSAAYGRLLAQVVLSSGKLCIRLGEVGRGLRVAREGPLQQVPRCRDASCHNTGDGSMMKRQGVFRSSDTTTIVWNQQHGIGRLR